MSASRVATIDLSAESVRTGEAVELDIIPAEPPYRFVSAFVDFAAYAATAVTVFYMLMHSWRHPTDQQQKIFSILLVASATLLAPLAVEALTRGSSLGKWAFSLRVVRDDGGPASLRHIFVRRLVGGIGVANTMIISVLERRREIGLRRSLGAMRGHILVQFMTEALLLASLGGALGCVIGVGVTAGMSAANGWPFSLPVIAVVGGLGVTIAIGALAGVYPAVRASRTPPTAALNAQ